MREGYWSDVAPVPFTSNHLAILFFAANARLAHTPLARLCLARYVAAFAAQFQIAPIALS